MDGYIKLLEDLIDVTKQESKERFANATCERTLTSIIDWDASYKLEGLIKKEYLTVLQKIG
jgi:hypothetical protein